jgi:D-alanyl-D-alanine dipeptidase
MKFARLRPFALVLAAALAWPLTTAAQSGGGSTFRLDPARPIEELRVEALKATPPREAGEFRLSDLVEFARLAPSIKLDIRYATPNNFLGTPFYSEARAFLQRPAAEALLRVHHALRAKGYGLLIFDAYRPWYVTRILWDAYPAEPQKKRGFVADPATGSIHNRGCAVDLSLYDLRSGRPLPMPSGYDEMTERASPSYGGGTAEETANRELLRAAMEREGFTVEPTEWWHFNYKDAKRYRIENAAFESFPAAGGKQKP